MSWPPFRIVSWIVLSTHLDFTPQICALLRQRKPRFDLIRASITARCDLFKIDVGRYGQSMNLKGKRCYF